MVTTSTRKIPIFILSILMPPFVLAQAIINKINEKFDYFRRTKFQRQCHREMMYTWHVNDIIGAWWLPGV